MMIVKYATFLIGFSLLAILTSCASYSSFQTARTVEKGTLAGSLGAGNNYLGDEGFVDIKLRAGIADSADLGATFNYTMWGSTVIGLDFKKQLKTKGQEFQVALGGAISSVSGDDQGLALHLPAYISRHSPNEKLTVYLNPRLLYYFDLNDDAEYDNSGFAVANSLGLKFGNRISLMPEWGLLYGRHNVTMKVNNFFGVGLAHRIR